jgi:ATP-dependent DNA helicase Rep
MNIELLNPIQRMAVEYFDGPLLVLAGAGSGKTRVIANKIYYLIQVLNIPAHKILALTFTNKAAKEMAKRVQNSKGLNVSTFHRLGLTIIKKEHEVLGLKQNFTLFDEEDGLTQLRAIADENTPLTQEGLVKVKSQISFWKGAQCTPDRAMLNAEADLQIAALYYKEYQNRLKIYHAVDFDDLIALPVDLFTRFPDILDKWQDKFRYILVDEYQDTNENQYQLLKLLTGVRQAFTVVGDDDQAIYAWRGAKAENIQTLKNDFPNLNIVKLEQNYRSMGNILKAANALIAHNPHLVTKNLWSDKACGEKIRVVVLDSEQDETQFLLEDLLNHQAGNQTQLGDYAILYRMNHQSRSLEQALRLRGIPYQVSGGTSFFSRAEIKDLIAYFRLVFNAQDDSAFFRIVNVPKREIGAATLEKLSDYAKERNMGLLHACFEMGLKQILPPNMVNRLFQFASLIEKFEQSANEPDQTPADIMGKIKEFIEEIGYESWLNESAQTSEAAKKKIENVQFFIEWMARILKKQADNEDDVTLRDVLNKMMLLDILDNQQKNNAETLNLMTLHAAKGLEFNQVYLIGMEEELLPHKNSLAENKVEEERRLAYVGLTRAVQHLIITYNSSRNQHGQRVEREPSRFLDEIPDELLARESFKSIGTSPAAKMQLSSRFADLKALLGEG